MVVIISGMGDMTSGVSKDNSSSNNKENLRLPNANHPAYCIREQSKPSLAHFPNPLRLIRMQ